MINRSSAGPESNDTMSVNAVGISNLTSLGIGGSGIHPAAVDAFCRAR